MEIFEQCDRSRSTWAIEAHVPQIDFGKYCEFKKITKHEALTIMARHVEGMPKRLKTPQTENNREAYQPAARYPDGPFSSTRFIECDVLSKSKVVPSPPTSASVEHPERHHFGLTLLIALGLRFAIRRREGSHLQWLCKG